MEVVVFPLGLPRRSLYGVTHLLQLHHLIVPWRKLSLLVFQGKNIIHLPSLTKLAKLRLVEKALRQRRHYSCRPMSITLGPSHSTFPLAMFKI
jgi:hypothetical protein